MIKRVFLAIVLAALLLAGVLWWTEGRLTAMLSDALTAQGVPATVTRLRAPPMIGARARLPAGEAQTSELRVTVNPARPGRAELALPEAFELPGTGRVEIGNGRLSFETSPLRDFVLTASELVVDNAQFTAPAEAGRITTGPILGALTLGRLGYKPPQNAGVSYDWTIDIAALALNDLAPINMTGDGRLFLVRAPRVIDSVAVHPVSAQSSAQGVRLDWSGQLARLHFQLFFEDSAEGQVAVESGTVFIDSADLGGWVDQSKAAGMLDPLTAGLLKRAVSTLPTPPVVTGFERELEEGAQRIALKIEDNALKFGGITLLQLSPAN